MSIYSPHGTKAKWQPSITSILADLLQRQCACGQHTIASGECAECRQKREGTMQRSAVNPTPTNTVPPIVHDVLNSPGQPLDAGTRAFMEPRFGHNFSGVRVHTDARAAESARSVNALAYTVGRNVVFGTGQYAPGTSEGRKLLAHELTHVAQQHLHTAIPSRRPTTASSSDSLEREADSTANTIEQSHIKPIQGFCHNHIQRQPAATGSPIHTPWDDLPTDAQRAISKDYFNSLDRETQSAFRSVYTAMTTEGLWKDVIHVTNVFPRNTRGIDAYAQSSFIGQLFSHGHFCRDTQYGGSQHKGQATWRQLVGAGTEGLHIGIISPNRISVHLDTIAPVDGRESNGDCRYSMPYVLPHISKDLKGWRNLELFPPPTSEPRSGDVQPWAKITIPGT
jgi:hypothetical protein